MFLLDEAHRLAQELQDLEPLGRGDGVGIQLIELPEEANVRWADVDERQRLQPFRAAGRIREIGSSVQLDARGIEARHGQTSLRLSAAASAPRAGAGRNGTSACEGSAQIGRGKWRSRRGRGITCQCRCCVTLARLRTLTVYGT